MGKLKNILTLVLSAGFIAVFTVWSIASPDKAESLSERRLLTKFPTLSAQTVADGTFMSGFEKYSLDQFPLRDRFRTLKAYTALGVFRERDNGGIYLADGHVSKLDFQTNTDSAKYAARRFSYVYDKYLKDSGAEVYLSLIPDKNYFLAKKNGYPATDYAALTDTLTGAFYQAKYIDITGTLAIDDYYRTDSHWRQERIIRTADALARGMGTAISGEYDVIDTAAKFRGVYYGQSALPLEPDTLLYLENDAIRSISAYDHESDSAIPVYNTDATDGRDPYEMFLGGAKSIVTVDNPTSVGGRELILFRDSFGSSIAPLLAEGYSRVTLVDIRYIAPASIGRFINADENTDVLFLYSTSVINNSETIK